MATHTTAVMLVVVIGLKHTILALTYLLDLLVLPMSPSYLDNLLLATTTVDRVALSQPLLHLPFP